MNRHARRIRRCFTWSSGLVVSFLALRGDALAQGCAMCRTALGSEDDPLARGFNHSILFMMSTPYLVVGSIGAWLAYRHVVASRRAEEAPTDTPEIAEEHPGTVTS
jgi:hypothetical protein